MDWGDLTRLAILVGYASAVGIGVWTVGFARLPLRKFAAVTVTLVALAWFHFYLWVVPTFWNTYQTPETWRAWAPIFSRIAGGLTVVGLHLVLWTIRKAESTQNAAIELAAKHLREVLDDC